MEESVNIKTVLEELREFRKENNNRLTILEAAVDKNTKNINRLEVAVDKNTKNINRLEVAVDRNTENINRLEIAVDKNTANINRLEEISKKSVKRITSLEEERKKDRNDILDVLDRMEKSISNRFDEMKDYIDVKFDKIYAAQMVNDIEHAEFRQLLKAYGIKLNFYDVRIRYLEEWKKQLGDDGFITV